MNHAVKLFKYHRYAYLLSDTSGRAVWHCYAKTPCYRIRVVKLVDDVRYVVAKQDAFPNHHTHYLVVVGHKHRASLYPPKDNPKNWGRDAPLWVYEMWEYIVRGFLGLKRTHPDWALLPQMMRFSVSTWNVLKMLGMWEGARPHNFMFMVMTSEMYSFDWDVDNTPNKKPMVIVPFSSKQNQWCNLEGFDVHTRYRSGRYRPYRTNNPAFRPFTFAHMMVEYIRHPEAKSLGPDGKPCTAETHGLLQRAHITTGQIRYIDKETTSMWAEGDDLSVVTDNDEAGFRVVEYGKGRMVILPDSVKREMREVVGLRELRRRGIGQHTIEKALHDKIRMRSYRKILAAIEEYKARQGK